ncbi:MAG: HAD hydrolase-like protein [Candidatus Omnitrophica bacterium]|nr:HAD hydrolase-like protein [Candidatus Omnitrophota bacterium]
MKKALAFDSVIFDIDNVLIDTRRSYLEAIRWTVDLYLTSGAVPLFRRSTSSKSKTPYLISPADVEAFKMLGGFNDDWDCCYGMLCYLLSLRVKTHELSELKKQADIPGLAQRIRRRPLRVRGIIEHFGRSSAVTIEKVSRIFQEVYLGSDLFKSLEKKKPVYWKKRGLIHKEKSLFRKKTLQKLIRLGVRLGIATGRPRFEASYALRDQGLFNFFSAMTTIDDVKRAELEFRMSLRKPHPFSILETAKKIGREHRFLYVGDLPDDILAAKGAAKEIAIQAAGLPLCATNPKAAQGELENSGADFILKKPTDLAKIVIQGKL